MAVSPISLKRLLSLRRSHALRGVGTLALGTAAGQGIVTAAAPLLTRLYSPAEMGDFGTFTALTSFFIAFACLRLEQTLLLVREDDQPNAIAACLLSSVVIVAVYELIIALAPPGLRNLPSAVRTYAAILGPLSIISSALYVTCQHLALRSSRLVDVARYQVLKSAIATAAQVCAALVGLGFVGLAGGQVVGLTVAVLPMVYQNRHTISALRTVRRSNLIAIYRRYSSFPLYGAPQAALNASTASLPMFMIGAFFGPMQVGLFWLGFRVFGLPNQVIVESLRGGLLTDFSARLREGRNILHPLAKATFLMAVILLPISLLLFFLGPLVFGVIFGAQWKDAGNITAILSIGWIFQNARIPSTVILQLQEKQKTILVLEILGTIGRALSLASASLGLSIESVLTFFIIVNLMQSIATVFVTIKELTPAHDTGQEVRL